MTIEQRAVPRFTVRLSPWPARTANEKSPSTRPRPLSLARDHDEATTVNEWGFGSEIKSWWDAEIARHPEWGLDRCETESQTEGSRKRSDLVVRDSTGQVKLAGELRLPDHPQSHPHDPENLTGAINKALQHGAPYAFTSDGTIFLLIDVAKVGRPLERVVDRIDIIEFEERRDLDDGVFLDRLRDEWNRVLQAIAPVVVGAQEPPGMSPDEMFVESLRALLRAPVASIRRGLHERDASDGSFHDDLIRWMVDEQGWVHNPNELEAEIQRVSSLSAYVFITRLLFYEALRQTHSELDDIRLSGMSAPLAVRHTEAVFELAKRVSGDYQTLFDWDRANEFALITSDAVRGWDRVLERLGDFQLAVLGYDILGRIFERLIEPTERYRWGQHYTQPDVVDLMLAFAIPGGCGNVLDPASGGGTFLVRAYERKRYFRPDSSHQERLRELFGIDISTFAATVSTINLASRHLAFEDNYPQVAANSFFRVTPASSFIQLPLPGTTLGTSYVEIDLPELDAVVCNPPYVRRQELSDHLLEEARRTLANPTAVVPPPGRVNRNANYHVYFWFHAAQFLKTEGRLVFITSGEWLDSDYGAALQKWLLDHFRLEAIVESRSEPWFSEARVGTVVVVAQRCEISSVRDANVVRFVALRTKLASLFEATGADGRVAQATELCSHLLSLPAGHHESVEMDWSTATQLDLAKAGYGDAVE